MKDCPDLCGYEKENNKGVWLSRTIRVVKAAKTVFQVQNPGIKRYKTKQVLDTLRRRTDMQKAEEASHKGLRTITLGVAAASLLILPIALEVRLKRATRPLTDAWRHLPIEPRRSTLLGISFRSPQVAALGLDARATLRTLLAYPFQLIRLGAYWNRIEPEAGTFYTDELDWQVDAAERAGKRIILCVGPLKTFSYPEFFVPAHHLAHPLQEHTLIEPSAYQSLLTAATAFITRLVERFKHRQGIVAWQLEHEAVDPLGMEHTWRLDARSWTKTDDCRGTGRAVGDGDDSTQSIPAGHVQLPA
jgi:glycosyl hydrolase family 42 (putative beta-galactosidase)